MVRIVLLLILVAVILAIRYLPWWALLGGPALLVLLAWLLRGRIFMWLLGWLFRLPFKAKGRVLHKAVVEVHDLRRVAEPIAARLTASEPLSSNAREDVDHCESASTPIRRDYYELEATITPRAATGAFKLWEAGELMLVRPGKKWDEDDDSCEVVRLDIARDGVFGDDEGLKYFGPQRLRLLIGVKPGVDRLCFAYYFEQFGELNLALARGLE